MTATNRKSRTKGCDVPDKVAIEIFDEIRAGSIQPNIWKFTASEKWSVVAKHQGMLSKLLLLTEGRIPRSNKMIGQWQSWLRANKHNWAQQDIDVSIVNLRALLQHLLKCKRLKRVAPRRFEKCSSLITALHVSDDDLEQTEGAEEDDDDNDEEDTKPPADVAIVPSVPLKEPDVCSISSGSSCGSPPRVHVQGKSSTSSLLDDIEACMTGDQAVEKTTPVEDASEEKKTPAEDISVEKTTPARGGSVEQKTPSAKRLRFCVKSPDKVASVADASSGQRSGGIGAEELQDLCNAHIASGVIPPTASEIKSLFKRPSGKVKKKPASAKGIRKKPAAVFENKQFLHHSFANPTPPKTPC